MKILNDVLKYFSKNANNELDVNTDPNSPDSVHENDEHAKEIGSYISRLEHVRSNALNNGADDLLTERLLSHPVRDQMPTIKFGSAAAENNANRVAVAERLLKAYRKAVTDEETAPIKREGQDMWTQIISKELQGLTEALETQNAEKLADVLMLFGSSFVWFGGVTTCIDGYNRNLEQNHVALTYWDKLLRVAEYLGVRPLENPESGPWGDAMNADAEALAAQIEEAIGISICAPLGVIHTDGLIIKDGILHYRHINALYSALRLTHLMEGKASKSVCEYGSGLGLTALYARRLGIVDYTILDLPITCLLSGHYLLHACGEDAVSLYGESEGQNRIKIRPYWECQSSRENQYAITLNQDGFNEMAENMRVAYRDEIKRTTSDYFLSINHECFFPKTVANLMKGDSDYRKLSRAPYWPREGYVEELFEIT